MTGTCQQPHTIPSRMAEGSQLFAGQIIFGKTKPVQPISSKNPATRPKPAPGKNRLGAKVGDENVFRKKSTPVTKMGGTSSAAYQRTGNFQRLERRKRSARPARPSKILVSKMPDRNGPRSITGNIMTPVNFGMDSPRKRRGATSRKAPSQEIEKVRMK